MQDSNSVAKWRYGYASVGWELGGESRVADERRRRCEQWSGMRFCGWGRAGGGAAAGPRTRVGAGAVINRKKAVVSARECLAFLGDASAI